MHIFVSGRPSLDLLGTVKWRRDDPEELLRSAADLQDWFAASPLGLPVIAEPKDIDRVRTVREALYRTVAAIRTGTRPVHADRMLLNDVASGPGPRVSLTVTGSVRRSVTVEQALALVIRDAFDVLSGGDLARVGDCANPRCSRLFVDRSRGGTRRWCGMTECGNTAKVAAFRAQQHS